MCCEQLDVEICNSRKKYGLKLQVLGVPYLLEYVELFGSP